VNQAITTKYHGPTDTRGARISATSESGIKVFIPYPHELRSEEGHIKAMRALCSKLKWVGKYVGGAVKNGYVFVALLPNEIVEVTE
jgi:hypothetical protein